MPAEAMQQTQMPKTVQTPVTSPNAVQKTPGTVETKPLWKKWWLWVIVGVIIIGIGVGIYFLLS